MIADLSHLTYQERFMRYLGVTLAMTAILALPFIIAGGVMLRPEHSEQARPKLDHIAVAQPKQEPKAYQGRSHDPPTAPQPAECPEPPNADADYRRLYVKVAEGDGDAMRRLVVADAKAHGAMIEGYGYAVRVNHNAAWDRRLAELSPWDQPRAGEHDNYVRWAEAAAARIAGATTATPWECVPLPYKTMLIIGEQKQGRMSDGAAKYLGWILIFIGIGAALLCASHPVWKPLEP